MNVGLTSRKSLDDGGYSPLWTEI